MSWRGHKFDLFFWLQNQMNSKYLLLQKLILQLFNLDWSLAEEFLGHWSLDYIWNSYVHFPLGILQKGISTKVWQSHDPLNNDLNRYQQFYNLFHRISVQKSRSLLMHCGQVFHARNHAATQNCKMGPKFFLRNYFWKRKENVHLVLR